MMGTEDDFTLVNVGPPDVRWVQEAGITPDRISVWPFTAFREGGDAAGGGDVTEMGVHDQVVVVLERVMVDGAVVASAIVLPVGVAHAMARMILATWPEDGGR